MKVLFIEKVCTKCGTSRPLIEYYTDQSKKDGLHSQCIPCHKKRGKEYRQGPMREALLARQRQYRIDHPERYKASVRNSILKFKYGITTDEFDRLFAEQGNACAICGGTESRGNGRFHVDHDHETGKIRGILCQACNTTLGKMHDSPALLRKAAAYLEAR